MKNKTYWINILTHDGDSHCITENEYKIIKINKNRGRGSQNESSSFVNQINGEIVWVMNRNISLSENGPNLVNF